MPDNYSCQGKTAREMAAQLSQRTKYPRLKETSKYIPSTKDVKPLESLSSASTSDKADKFSRLHLF